MESGSNAVVKSLESFRQRKHNDAQEQPAASLIAVRAVVEIKDDFDKWTRDEDPRAHKIHEEIAENQKGMSR